MPGERTTKSAASAKKDGKNDGKKDGKSDGKSDDKKDVKKDGGVREGDKAPAFELESDSEERVSLRGLLAGGKTIVLYFYPRDDTPGCTREAQAFTEAKRKLTAAGALVVGVSKDSIKSHCKFRDKYGINFPLLSDPELEAHKAYGVYGEKTLYGKKSMGTIRSTFVIDPNGKIVRAFRGVKVDGHVDAVLDAIRGEGGAKKG